MSNKIDFYSQVYKYIANLFNSCIEEPEKSVPNSKKALHYIIDFNSSVNKHAPILKIKWHGELYKTHVHLIEYFQGRTYIKNVVSLINKTIEEEIDISLTEFVNNINWDQGCVPPYWAELSEECNFDVSEWNICS